MIPKIIHYCWFGSSDKNIESQKCIGSWKKYFPEYQIIEWNESNTDIGNSVDYVKEAYTAKKYAFVSDYYRLKALYEYGGIYFDTDYEVIRPMAQYFNEGSLVGGFEGTDSVLTAMIAVEPENEVIKEMVDSYTDRHFLMSDGTYDETTINEVFTRILGNYGLRVSDNEYQEFSEGICIYPVEVFCGFDTVNWHEKIGSTTVGVHHMSSSWANGKMKRHIKRIQTMQKLLGVKNYDRIKAGISIIKKITALFNEVSQ